MRNSNPRLWQAVEQSDLKREAIAEKCGLTVKSLGQVMRGRKSLTDEQKNLLSVALGVPVTELFPGTRRRQ